MPETAVSRKGSAPEVTYSPTALLYQRDAQWTLERSDKPVVHHLGAALGGELELFLVVDSLRTDEDGRAWATVTAAVGEDGAATLRCDRCSDRWCVHRQLLQLALATAPASSTPRSRALQAVAVAAPPAKWTGPTMQSAVPRTEGAEVVGSKRRNRVRADGRSGSAAAYRRSFSADPAVRRRQLQQRGGVLQSELPGGHIAVAIVSTTEPGVAHTVVDGRCTYHDRREGGPCACAEAASAVTGYGAGSSVRARRPRLARSNGTAGLTRRKYARR